MSLGPFASHPGDVIARHTAHGANADGLTDHFEHIVASDQPMPHRYGALQVLAAQAIARVRLLEEMVSEFRDGGELDPPDNVVLLHKVAPAPSTSRPSA